MILKITWKPKYYSKLFKQSNYISTLEEEKSFILFRILKRAAPKLFFESKLE